MEGVLKTTGLKTVLPSNPINHPWIGLKWDALVEENSACFTDEIKEIALHCGTLLSRGAFEAKIKLSTSPTSNRIQELRNGL